jgi:hypothetical protein
VRFFPLIEEIPFPICIDSISVSRRLSAGCVNIAHSIQLQTTNPEVLLQSLVVLRRLQTIRLLTSSDFDKHDWALPTVRVAVNAAKNVLESSEVIPGVSKRIIVQSPEGFPFAHIRVGDNE